MARSFRLPALAILLWTGLALGNAAPTYSYSTLAGVAGASGAMFNGTGGTASPTLFRSPDSLIVLPGSNLVVADTGNQVLRLVTPGGVVSTFAGIPGVAGVVNGTTSVAQFAAPQGLALDSSGNIYLADYTGHTIRKITPAGIVSTLAGTAGTSGAADGTGTAATFFSPQAVAVDSGGNVYVADTLNHTIRKITGAGVVTTFAGTAGTSGSTDATGTAALFNGPSGIVADAAGNLYVADTNNHTIRKITGAGVVTTLAGTGGAYGFTDATSGAAARFNHPINLCLSPAGNLIVADYLNNVVRQVTPAGVVTTLAGSLGGEQGRVDGPGTEARFFHPSAIAADSAGNLYVTDYSNQLIRRIASDGRVTTVAGAGGAVGFQNGVGHLTSPALFSSPKGVAVDNSGNIYVADAGNGLVRKITPEGAASTWGSATYGAPYGLARTTDGLFYVADAGTHTIHKLADDGTSTLFAGTSGTSGTTDGTGTAAAFSSPAGVAVTADGTVYVADTGNHAIRKISADGAVTLFAGTAGTSGAADGSGTDARFLSPNCIVVDPAGNLFVADTGNHTIRKITSAGLVTTFAGVSGATGRVDGSGAAALFNLPTSLTIDSEGNLYVADAGNDAVRFITPAGEVSTIGGAGGGPGSVDGSASDVRFNQPYGIALSADGSLYLSVSGSNTIVVGTPASSPGTGAGTTTRTYTSDTAPTGNLFAGDIWKKTVNGQVTATYRWDGTQWVDTSGTGTNPGGSGSPTVFLNPAAIAIDSSGNLYVADTGNHSIKKITSAGVATVLAGTDGSVGTTDATGAAARFNSPAGIAVDTSGNAYVADTGNGTIRKITSAGAVTTLAGSTSTRGDADGTGTAALFRSPTGVAVDSSGIVYVSDQASRTIRKITSDGVVTTFAGTAMSTGDANGTGGYARFSSPTGLAISSSSTVYLTDTNNQTIRHVNASGVVSTLAGLTGVSGAYDGTSYDANFNLPQGIHASSTGYVYVADTANSTIRRITGSGYVVTLAGLPGISGYMNTAGGTPLFNQPMGVVADSSGNVYVLDTGNSAIRKIAADGTVTTLSLTAGSSSGSSDGDSDSGGGGAPSPWFLALLAALGAARLQRRRSAP